MTGDPGRAVERDGDVVVVTPCGCRCEVALDRAQAQARRWQACPGCGRLWLLYVLGSGRVLWSQIRAEPQRIRRPFEINRVWGWRR
ncbi:MAG: hypothetical protein ACRDZ4_04300 [Egibacteraceae bacterium]